MSDRVKVLLAVAGAAVLLAALGLDLYQRFKPGPPPIYEGDPDSWDGEPLAFQLTDVSTAAGVAHTHRKFTAHPSLRNVEPWLVAYEGGVAVADVDGDGRPDIYLTSAKPGSRNSLFRNNGDGTFIDIAKRAGLADVNRNTGSVRPLFFDYDNDGDKDLLLTTYHRARLFRNKGDGTFTDATKKSRLIHRGFAPASNVIDYDNDGDLDVVIGNYFKRSADLLNPTDYKFMHHDLRRSGNGGRATVYRNNGDGTFSPAPGNLGIRDAVWNLAIGVYDFRGTGRPDLHFGLDYHIDRLYYNEGDGRFVDAGADLADTQSLSSMSSEIADVFNEGRPSIFVSNIYSPLYVAEGNVLWKMSGEGRFADRAKELGVWRCAWAWGSKFVDLDNDTFQDLVVVNGYISADPKKTYYPSMRLFMDPDVEMEDARLWPAMEDASMDGYQQSCVFRNTGKGFVNVVGGTGMKGDLSDSRGLAVIDYLDDGSPGLVVSNLGQPARLYRNERRNKNRWIGFKLKGTRSNRDAFGSRVTVRLKGGTVLSRQLQPANGFMAQSDDRLHFGLGPDPVIEEVTLRWPAGGKRTLRGLELDRYHTVVEGAPTTSANTAPRTSRSSR